MVSESHRVTASPTQSVFFDESPELMPPAPPEVLVSAEASVEEAGGQGAGGKGEEISLEDLSPAASKVSTTPERERELEIVGTD
jgi:hypothetical protein